MREFEKTCIMQQQTCKYGLMKHGKNKSCIIFSVFGCIKYATRFVEWIVIQNLIWLNRLRQCYFLKSCFLNFLSNMDIILHLLIYFFFNANNFYIVRKFCSVTNSVFTSWLVHDDSLQKINLFIIYNMYYLIQRGGRCTDLYSLVRI